jgi:hypothetical protein
MEDDTNLVLKYIVEELSQEPFNYELNAVAFASLSHEPLLNVRTNELDNTYSDLATNQPIKNVMTVGIF